MSDLIDLRSDTVTQPTSAMRAAMATAVVGDDGFGEDETVHELERTFADMVGKEAAVFVPSGVMSNQIAVRVLTRPGDLVATGAHQHVVSFEMGASARNASVQFVPIDDRDGRLSIPDLVNAIDAELDHQPHVAMVCIENTHMYAGGAPWSAHDIDELAGVIGTRPLHLDGARLFNAAVATGDSPRALSASATLVTACLSKGLCAPVGSVLAGPSELIDAARIERKRLGGAMRQAGFMAAAGLVALDTMIDRLAEDHARAARLAHAVSQRFPESAYDPSQCRTNIVAFEHRAARSIVARLRTSGVRCDTIAPTRVRLVTHANLTEADVDRACDIIGSLSLQ